MARSCTEANIPQDAVAVPVDTLLIFVQGRIDVDVLELFLRVRLQLQQATNGLGVDIHFVLGRPIMLVMASISTASVAAKNARADSDVDVAALAETPLDAGRKIRLISDIAPATGRPVDLIDLATVGAPDSAPWSAHTWRCDPACAMGDSPYLQQRRLHALCQTHTEQRQRW